MATPPNLGRFVFDLYFSSCSSMPLTVLGFVGLVVGGLPAVSDHPC
jgi:hypothetical protein